ncbi:uncharacterized protein LOC113352106 [Papaver somniferum]|uniref:uncharacterized protein LOC113352106 n=1 Tax=Papaver somniferum TaxID=3469 RepID=UPI000E7050E8|nr:uncharacterized protein LOC113352106 [Papaver somniferum]
MVINGRLQCFSRRKLSTQEQLQWDSLCNELGPVPDFSEEADELLMEGDFSVHECYNMQLEDRSECSFEIFLWNKNIPSKVSFMLWTNFHNSLPTLTMLSHRGVNVQSKLCVYCQQVDETADHIFLHCPYAAEVWSFFVKAFKVSWTFPTTVLDHFESWRLNNLQGKCRKLWWMVNYAILWHLWKERSSRVFGGRHKLVDETILLIMNTIILWCFENEVFRGFSVNQILFHSDTVIHM